MGIQINFASAAVRSSAIGFVRTEDAEIVAALRRKEVSEVVAVYDAGLRGGDEVLIRFTRIEGGWEVSRADGDQEGGEFVPCWGAATSWAFGLLRQASEVLSPLPKEVVLDGFDRLEAEAEAFSDSVAGDPEVSLGVVDLTLHIPRKETFVGLDAPQTLKTIFGAIQGAFFHEKVVSFMRGVMPEAPPSLRPALVKMVEERTLESLLDLADLFIKEFGEEGLTEMCQNAQEGRLLEDLGAMFQKIEADTGLRVRLLEESAVASHLQALVARLEKDLETARRQLEVMTGRIKP